MSFFPSRRCVIRILIAIWLFLFVAAESELVAIQHAVADAPPTTPPTKSPPPKTAEKASEILTYNELTISRKENGNSLALFMRSGPFEKAHHKITGSKEDPLVDGKRALGTDGGLPFTEFMDFTVTVNGKAWKFPRKLWSDCYEPNLYAGKDKSVWASLSPDASKLAIGMHGSDGAGTYYVVWYLRKDGHNSREVRYTEEGWEW